ncbi:MAG: tRNA-(ms[2]io[6]A)-hydroxylase [Pirellula sp.]|jgi:tRNA-(ms[2]io[6]A)-hydroxylase
MLHLQSESQSRWLKQVQGNLREILIDHAHCEYKAAATAMSLIGAYVDCEELTREMAVIVQEELEHFHMVLDLLKRRNIRFRRLRPGDYGKRLNAMVRSDEPNRAVDRLLVAGLIEARSCERFKLLREHIDDKELADFYGSLFESEARHHTTYVRLAKLFQDAEMVRQRLEELSAAESEIIAEGHPLARMHS